MRLRYMVTFPIRAYGFVPAGISVMEWIVENVTVTLVTLGISRVRGNRIRRDKVAQDRVIEPGSIIHQAVVGVQPLPGEAHIGQVAVAQVLERDLAIGLVILPLQHFGRSPD